MTPRNFVRSAAFTLINRRNDVSRHIKRLRVESLEDRTVPAIRTWTGLGTDDLWSNVANWDTGVPQDGDDVRIAATAESAEVLFDSSVLGGGVTLNRLTSDGSSPVSEPFRITGAALTLSGAGPFVMGASFDNSGLVNIGANSTFTMSNGGTSTGDWNIDATGALRFNGGSYLLDNGTDMTGAGSATVLGGGTAVNAGDAAADAININNFTINENATLTANGALHATGNLTLGGSGDGNTLNGTGIVTIDGFFSWQSGIMSGSGTNTATTIANGGINLGGNLTLDGRQLDNAATATWTGGSQILLEHGAVFNNGSDLNHNAVFDAQVTGSISHSVGDAAAFNNFGTFKKTAGAGGATSILVPFNNNGGTVDVQAGELLFRSGGTSTGPWTVAAAAQLSFFDRTYDLNAGSKVTGDGNVRFAFSTVNMADTYSASHTEFQFGGNANFNAESSTTTLTFGIGGGTLGGSGDFTVNGLFTWQGGIVTGAGTMFANGDINLSGNSFLTGRTVDLAANHTLTLVNSTGFTMSDGAVFNNHGTFDAQVDQSIGNGGGATSIFINNGTFKKSAGTATNILVPFTNNATIDVQTGTVSVNGPSGGLTNFPIASTANIESSPTGATESGTTVTITISNGNTHQFLVVGQTVTISGVAEAGYNGTFTVTAVPNATTFQYTAATSGLPNSGGGTATFLSTQTLTGGTYLISGTFQFNGADIVTNAATIVLNGPTSKFLNFNGTTTADALPNFATNAAGGSFTIQNGRNFTPGSAFSNAGTVTVGAGSQFILPNGLGFTQSGGTTNLQGGAITDLTPPTGNALAFDGNDDVVAAPDSPDFTLGSNPFTIETWINADALSGIHGLVGQDEGGGTLNKWFFLLNGNQLQFHINGPTVGSTFFGAGTIPNTGQWHHVAVSRSGSTYAFFIDGSVAGTVDNGTVIPDAAAPLTIGQVEPAHGPIPGRMDEVRIWNVARSQNEIVANMGHSLSGAEAGLVAYYRLDEGSGTVAFDRTANHHDGVLGAGNAGQVPAWVATLQGPPAGNALSFDSSNDFAQAADSASLQPTNVTLECWFNLNATPGVTVLMSKTLGAANFDSYVLFLIGNQLTGGICDTAGGAPTVSFTLSAATGTWHHAAFTFDDAADLETLYVDGVQVATASTAKSIGYDNHPVLLGADNENGSLAFFLPGRIDEARVWSVARTPAEIQANMSHTLNGNESNLAAYWRLDEGTGDTAFDRTANHNDLLLGGGNLSQQPAWTTTGVNLLGGLLSGAGTVGANVLNAAAVAPGQSPGILYVGGDYTQTAAGSLIVEVGGTSSEIPDFDQVDITGAANLDGTLKVMQFGGFVPSASDTFRIVNAASRTGVFATVNSQFPGAFFLPNYDATGVTLEVNVAPIAAADAGTTLEDTAVTTNVIANDSDPDGDTFTVVATSTSTPGATVVNNGDGTVTYTPPANSNGSDSYSYTIRDTVGNETTGTVTINITPVNDAPTLDAISDPAAILEDSGLQTINLTGITAGPNESQTLTVTAISSNPGLIPDPSVNYTSPNSTGFFTYTPVTNQSGTAVITVTVSDDGGTANGGVDTFVRTFMVTVTPANDQPVLDVTAKPMLPFIPTLGNVLPIGGRISDLTKHVTDVDPTDPKGIAVVTVDNTKGKWQFNLQFNPASPDAGWADITSVAATNALLLADDADTRIRFVPIKGFTGFSSVTFKAWDESNAEVEGSFDNTTVAGDTSYTAASDRGWIAVGKTKPTVDVDGRTVLAPVLPVIKPGATSVRPLAPVQVKTLLGVTGLEGPTIPIGGLGVAITAADTSDGAWQFKRIGIDKDFQPVAVGGGTILLLRPTDQLRFQPSLTANGPAPLTFKAWDPTGGIPGPSNIGPTGPAFGTDPGTAVLDLVPIMDLSVPAVLDPINAGQTTNDGLIFADMMSITRVINPNLGVAIIKTTGTGTWEYRPSGATAWTPVGTVSTGKALFLEANTEIRFTAAASALPQTPTLSFKAWDETKVAAGSRGSASGTSVSKETEIVTVAIGNDPPVLNTTPDVTLPSVSSSSTTPIAGVKVAALLGTAFSDTATKLLRGIAITAVDNTNGRWQYSLGGNKVVDVGAVSKDSALLLADTAKIRFVPNNAFVGTATISYKGWDRSAGQVGDRIDTDSGLNSFSVDIETATITVTA